MQSTILIYFQKSPVNDQSFSSTYKGGPKSVRWVFDDDKA